MSAGAAKDHHPDGYPAFRIAKRRWCGTALAESTVGRSQPANVRMVLQRPGKIATILRACSSSSANTVRKAGAKNLAFARDLDLACIQARVLPYNVFLT